jgi:hypothetical protein
MVPSLIFLRGYRIVRLLPVRPGGTDWRIAGDNIFDNVPPPLNARKIN